MTSLTMTIGRNVDGNPMNEVNWVSFRNQLKRQLAQLGMETVVSNLGTGEWEGISEDNYIIQGIRERDLADDERDALEHNLQVFATMYSQESIAFSVGQSNLIFAVPQVQKAVA